MTEYGVAIDLGTSGFRAQAVDLENGSVLSTAITLRHPLPGINIMDHLTFVIDFGLNLSHRIVIDAVDKLLERLEIDLKKVSRIAVSGNPVQLSLFQGIECRDLAWAGESALKRIGIKPPKRDSTILKAADIGLRSVSSEADILIPPCIKHEVGADAIAMMLKSGFLNEKLAIVADYGTNAEMALKIGDEILTGSAAAGPAIEGQSIERGILASPGAISDLLEVNKSICKNIILDDKMLPVEGHTVDLISGEPYEINKNAPKAKGITGTGVIAAIALGISCGLIKLPRILSSDRKLHFQDGVYLTEKDVSEAGKALGAFRAGFLTLAEEGGVNLSDVDTMYMAGASGFYVDPVKAKMVGEIPHGVEKVYQVGNTSLSLAVDIVKRTEYLDELQEFAENLRAKHVMFANSEIFKNIYILELAYWLQGMSIEKYNEFLERYRISQKIQKPTKIKKISKLQSRDISDFGKKGLRVIEDIGTIIEIDVDGCTECKSCLEKCAEGAILSVKDGKVRISSSLCLGTACRRCIVACPVKVLDFNKAKVTV